MYEVPTDTVDRPIADTFPLQPNTPAPIAHVPQEPFAIPQGADMSWLTKRGLAIGIGVGVLGAILVTGFRSSGTPETIKVAPIQNSEPSRKDTAEVVLNADMKLPLETHVTARKLNMAGARQSAYYERSLAILAEAKNHAKDPKNKIGCFKKGATCYLLKYAKEQNYRYSDAAKTENWANFAKADFEVEAATMALSGFKPEESVQPSLAFGSIENELAKRDLMIESSQEALANDLYGLGKQK